MGNALKKMSSIEIEWDEISFFDIDISSKSYLTNYFERVECVPGEPVLKTGDHNDCLYIVQSGSLRVYKNYEDFKNSKSFIFTLEEHHIFGEISALLSTAVGATIIADGPATLLKLNISDLNDCQRSLEVLHDLQIRAGKEIAAKLERSNSDYANKLEKENEYLRDKKRYSLLFTNLITALSIYTFLLDIMEKIKNHLPADTIISSVIILSLTVLFAYLLKKSETPPESYGLTLKNWKQNIINSFLYTLPVLLFIFAVKLAWVKFDTTGTIKLFQPESIFQKPEDWNLSFYLGAIAVYGILSTFQEFIGRCGIQSTLKAIYKGESSGFETKAIFVSSILFMATHAHLGVIFSAMTFLPSLFWGWIYNKQDSLVGPAFSHMLIGIFAIFILGFPV